MKNDYLGCKKRCKAKGGQGKDGANGKSAYEIWLEEGNTGSKQDFLDSLKGKDGTGGDSLDLTAVPEKQFEQGSSVLAFDPSGELYRFKEDVSYYKDLAIELSASQGSKLENDNTQYAVTAKISNTKPTEVSSATVALSAGGTLRDFTVNSADDVTVTNEGEGNYTITNLTGYGVVTISFNVEVSDNTYVSGSVTATGDTVSSNNSATLNLVKLATSQKSKNNYTETCPYVQATAVEDSSNTPLAVGVQAENANNFRGRSLGSTDDGLTILTGRQSLNGAELNLLGASTVQVYVSKDLSRYDRYEGNMLIKQLSESQYKTWFVPSEEYNLATTDDYTFDSATGLLTFNSDIYGAYIYLRPAGSACKWQTYWVGANEQDLTLTFNVSKIAVEGLDESHISYTYGQYSDNVKAFSDLVPAVIFSNEIKVLGEETAELRSFNNLGYWERQDQAKVWGKTEATIVTNSVLNINLEVGNAYEFDILAEKNVLPEVQGNIAISWIDGKHHVIVKDTATATDDIYGDKVRITLSL